MSSRMSRAVQDMPQPTMRGTDGILEGPIPGSLAFCAKTAKVDSLLHRHLVWESAGDGSVWQLSVSQFSSPASGFS